MTEAIIWAVKNGDLDALKAAVEQPGFDVNGTVSSGRRLIHNAADYGQEEIIRYLVSKGADVNAPDRHGITPLLAAIWEGHETCVKLLLEKGARKDGRAPDGSTYIDSAEKESIKLLLS